MAGIDYVNQYFGLPLQWAVDRRRVCWPPRPCWPGTPKLRWRRAGGGISAARHRARRCHGGLRPAQRDLARKAVHRPPHSTPRAPPTASTSRTSEDRVPGQARGIHRRRRNTSRCSITCACGIGRRSGKPCRRFSRCGLTCTPTSTWIATRWAARCGRCCWPRARLDLNASGEARSRWINPHFIYTHGYGIVMAEANRSPPTACPCCSSKMRRRRSRRPDLKLTRPEIYFGEQSQDPVFRAHGAAGVQLSGGRAQRADPLRRRRAAFRSRRLPSAHRRGRLGGRLEHSAHRLPDARKPHDDPPQGHRPAGDAGRLRHCGTPILTWCWARTDAWCGSWTAI